MDTIVVLMSTYNGEKYILEQINSILNQNVKANIKLIVRDDGSKDSTVSILKSITDDRFMFYQGNNVGAGFGFLQMILDNPGYDYYAFSDQDDYWLENKLQVAIDTIKDKDKYALYCSNTEMCNNKLEPLGRNVHKNMTHFTKERVFLGLACAQGCTCVFNKKLADKIIEKGLPTNIVFHDSFITCLCFALDGYFVADEWLSMKYRMHGNNIGGLQTKSQIGLLIMLKKRINYIISSPSKSIIDQLIEIKKNYDEEISLTNLIIFDNIILSKKSFMARMRFGFSNKIKDETLNLSLANRLKILLGNY